MNGSGWCECGCGQRTNLAKHPERARGIVRGQPYRFIAGHQRRQATIAGYRQRRIGGGKKRDEHLQVVEHAMGKPLPKGAVVHHVDENKSNNDPSNLVVCQDRAYHNLLHRRQRALDACGHAHWRRCGYCGTYDAPENMQVFQVGTRNPARHAACIRKYERARRAAA